MLEQAKTALIRAVELVGPNPYLQAGIIVVLAMVASSIARAILVKLCRRWAARSSTSIDDQFLHIIEKPIYLTVLLIGLNIAASRLPLSEGVATATTAALKTIGIVVWMLFFMRFARQVLSFIGAQRDRFLFVDNRTLPLLQNVSSLIIIIAAVYAFMGAWGIDVTALLASAGIVGLALSFAAKDTLANIFAGVSILADVPYKVGDFVVLQSGERGQVTHIGLRSSRLLTRDDVEITIPNAVMGNAKIINESGGPHEKYRIRVKVGVAYGSDLDHVCEVLIGVAASYPDVCVDPAPRVRVRGFGDYGIDVELLCWVENPIHRGRVLHELYMEVYKAFGREKIEIPYPKHEVFVQKFPTEAR